MVKETGEGSLLERLSSYGTGWAEGQSRKWLGSWCDKPLTAVKGEGDFSFLFPKKCHDIYHGPTSVKLAMLLHI